MNRRENLIVRAIFCGTSCEFLFDVLYTEQPGITTWMVETMTLFLIKGG